MLRRMLAIALVAVTLASLGCEGGSPPGGTQFAKDTDIDVLRQKLVGMDMHDVLRELGEPLEKVGVTWSESKTNSPEQRERYRSGVVDLELHYPGYIVGVNPRNKVICVTRGCARVQGELGDSR
jgi:hypothetical protein